MNNQTNKKLYVHNADQLKDYKKIGFWTRLRLRVFSANFLGTVIWKIFRFVLLVGISYIIIFPFITKISSSFFSPTDFTDSAVKLIPKNPTFDTYRAIIFDNDYFERLFNTATLSLFTAVIQTFITALIGYGFAKFKFKGRGIVFMLVILTMVIPQKTLMLSMFNKFRYFDIYGIISLLSGGVSESFNLIGGLLDGDTSLNLLNTNIPLYILSATGLAYKNGLYIFLLRQFFRGIPDELEESAYLDGSGVFKTFFSIIIPLSGTMLITVFMFSFCWQWTDNFYTELFYRSGGPHLLPDIIKIPKSLNVDFAGKELYQAAINNTAGILILIPLIIMYLFGQRYIVQGIERSGITG